MTFQLVFSMDVCILEVIILDRDLARKYNTNDQVKCALDKLWERRNEQPTIYAQYLVVAVGRSPTPNELRVIVEKMRSYCMGKEPKYANRVDNVRGSGNVSMKASEKGHRKYLTPTSSSDQSPNPERLDKALNFCDALAQRLKNLPAEALDKPLSAPLFEIGYTKHADKRLKSRGAHRSSNFLMNLTEAVCEVEHGNKYHMMQFAVCLIWQREHGALSEVFLNHARRGYTAGAAGLQIYVAGRSNSSNKSFTDD